MSRAYISLPTRGITWSDDDECTVPCHICCADVPAEFEPDPDWDGSGGVTTAESRCEWCSEPTCSECLNDDGLCAACEAEEQVASAPE